MNEPWNIQLFGALRVWQGERLITRFRTQQTGALLAYLAYHLRQSHSREALIERFWPDGEPEARRHTLCNALSSLRNQLEPPGVPSGSVLIADRFSVQLNPDAVATDVAEFEQHLRVAAQSRTAPGFSQRLAEAAERYGGPLLPHYYDDWIAPEKERLQQRFLQTVSQLIGLLEKAGELERALEHARRALSLDLFREESHRDVMRLLAASGQQEEALRQFRELERLFAQDLEETPSPAAQQLARQIEAQLAANPTSPPPISVPTRRLVGTDIASLPLPAGTVTFLLSDIEGSTALGAKAGEAFRSALMTHHALLRAEFRRNGGHEVKEAGDSFLVAFASASDALSCAIACQRALEAQPWPEAIGSLKVRMALHTGDVELEDGEYHGLMLHRAARMLAAGHGEQILASEATAALLRSDLTPGVYLTDLGVWRLQNLEEPVRFFQIETQKRERHTFPPLNAAPSYRPRLPLQFTRFFGRKAEIKRIEELLQSPETRFLTLTGPGGTGKTRLAIEAAEKMAERFQGGIWFVPLADLSDPGLIAGEIVDALGIPRTGQVEPLEQAVPFLARQPALLILDNFEQLVEGGAEILQTLLERIPTLTLLVTSRQLIALPGEREFAVPPLATPNGAHTPERLSLFESVQLFVDRAQTSRPDFRITNSNAAAVAELCDRLEGLPLAIELAAARALVLTPSQMLAQLGRRFEFLVSRKRGIVDRQRTLRAAVDWSYKLLAPELQQFFCRLSVFRSGWTEEAAVAVCEETLALDLLAQLRECSLILTDDRSQQMRFRMLETLREYGSEQLTEQERATLQRQHLDFFLRLAEEAEPELQGPEQTIWLDRLEREHDNLRAALAWSRSEEESAEAGLRLAAGLKLFWDMRGHLREGREQLTAVLSCKAAMKRTVARARALHGAAGLAYYQGDFAAARTLMQEVVAINRELGDRRGIASALTSLGVIESGQGNYSLARPLLEEGLAIQRETGDRYRLAASLNALGGIAYNQGDYADAQTLHEEGLAIRRELGDRQGTAISLVNTANVIYAQGDAIGARARYEESLEIFRELGHKRGISVALTELGRVACGQGDYAEARARQREALVIQRELEDLDSIRDSLENCAELEAAQSQPARAVHLWAAADALCETIGVSIPPHEREKYARKVATQRAVLGDAAFAAAWEAGRAMTWEEAVVYALEESVE